MAICFLLALAIRPAYYVGYFSYFQFNVDYIIETYCVNKERPELDCNGKCYLMERLNTAAAEKRATQESKALVNLSEAFTPLFVQYSSKYTFMNTTTFEKVPLVFYSSLHDYILVQRMLRPPSC